MTSAPVIDERVHRAALESLLTAALGPDRVYDYGEVPGADGNAGTLPHIFVLLSIERRYVEPRTASGLTGRSGWRVTCRYVGRTVDEARWAQMKTAQALEEKRLALGASRSTPVAHESANAIAPDDGRFAGWSVYTYAL